jgi:hypothetical protein
MRPFLTYDPWEAEPAPDLDSSVIPLDSRYITPVLLQEIVVLSDSAWAIWVTDFGEIVAARRGPDA